MISKDVTSDRPSDARPAPLWSRADTFCLFLLTVIGAGVRIPRLSLPAAFITDEYVYVPQACAYVRGLRSCGLMGRLYELHPPLGKWLIGFGIKGFGNNPLGWRAASVVAGILTIGLLYMLARITLRSTLGATIAAAALTFDFLHVVNSRIGMLDVFLTLFIVAAFLFFVLDRNQAREPGRRRRPYARPWLLACGASLGAAVATKWIGMAALITILALASGWEWERRRRESSRARSSLLRTAGPLVLYLLVVPALVYVGSYAGRIEGAIVAWPWSMGSWPRRFVGHQINDMLRGHVSLRGIPHTYGSPPWAWPLLKRPFVYYFEETPGGLYKEIVGLGNAFVWWGALIAIVAVAGQRIRKPRLNQAEKVILGGFVAGYGAWFVFGLVRAGGFSFYLLPAVPFMCLALGWAGSRLNRARALSFGIAIGLVLVVPFVFYYPVLTATPMSYSKWNQRILFDRCRPADAGSGSTPTSESTVTRERPDIRTGLPPKGWCWV